MRWSIDEVVPARFLLGKDQLRDAVAHELALFGVRVVALREVDRDEVRGILLKFAQRLSLSIGSGETPNLRGA